MILVHNPVHYSIPSSLVENYQSVNRLCTVFPHIQPQPLQQIGLLLHSLLAIITIAVISFFYFL